MIETLWALGGELWDYLVANFDPARDLIDIALVTVGIYWLLLLIQGTRAVQIVVGLIVLFALYLTSQLFQLATLELVLGNFLQWGIIIIIVLFQQDIRRGLARMGRGFFPSVAAREDSQMLEELVRAAQTLAQRKVGALIVLERENHIGEQIETGSALDAAVSKDLLVSLFMPYSPLHDGAAVVADGRIAFAGCILPLTLREDLPEGVGTRHRAAVGVTEETDAVVIVVSEETGTISVVLGGEMIQGLDAPRLRAVLRDILSGERSDLHHLGELRSEPGPETSESAQADTGLRTAG
ncbi:MAG TPA: diadenylate cyclase CdaA [Myxococcota bacterium]|nr:diadenylate cyclase CdaA [Myxococcota bacterium]